MSRFEIHHPQFDKFAYKWIRQRDVMGGEDNVKERGVVYLPALEGKETNGYMPQEISKPGLTDAPNVVPIQLNHRASAGINSYESYVGRATFLGASKRTAEGLHGAIFSKDPDIVFPDDSKLLDCGMRAESFDEILSLTVEKVVKIGRVGILIDAMQSNEEEDSDPYMSLYEAEDIVDWKEQRVGGRLVKTYIRIREAREERPSQDQPYETVVRYRELHLGVVPDISAFAQQGIGLNSSVDTASTFMDVPESYNGERVYYQMLWRLDRESTGAQGSEDVTTTENEVLESLVVPRGQGGVVFDEIPFEIFNPTSRTMKPEAPATEDLVILNLSHYRNSADLEHGLHITAIPQAWLSGFDFENGTILSVGGGAWVSKTPGASVGYLEFEGTGLGAISERMEVKRREMAMLGARMLEEVPRQGAEAERTMKLRRESDRTSLADIAVNIGRGMSNVLKWWAKWHGLGDDAETSVVLNEEYGTEGVDPQTLQSLIMAVQEGVMSWESVFWNLKRGGMIPQDIEQDAEITRIKANQSSLGFLPHDDQLEIENRQTVVDRADQNSTDSNTDEDDPEEESEEESDDADE